MSAVGALTDVATLVRCDLHEGLSDPLLDSMNQLNGMVERFPGAVSFAAGRPFEDFFDVENVHRYLRRYCEYLRTELGYDNRAVNRLLLQYGRTKGIMHELVARNLAVDEDIVVEPDAIVVTVGAQEGMYLVLRALCAGPADVLLAVAPAYIGIRGAARLVDMPVLAVRDSDAGLDLADLRRVVSAARSAGQRPRALYLVPDFANPSGVSLSPQLREDLLRAAADLDILLLEDNPYGLFHAGGQRPPTLKAMDRARRVIYLGSFAKTGMPGARVGYVVADQPVIVDGDQAGLLADELSKIKSMLTVNTSPLAQAVIAGRLLEHDCDLARANEREAEVYRSNLRQLLGGLATRFPRADPIGGQVRWNAPTGGFFVVMSVPFAVDDALLAHCGREYGVLWTPMRHFYGSAGGTHQLRLSISLVTPAQIEDGLDRLAAFTRDRISRL